MGSLAAGRAGHAGGSRALVTVLWTFDAGARATRRRKPYPTEPEPADSASGVATGRYGRRVLPSSAVLLVLVLALCPCRARAWRSAAAFVRGSGARRRCGRRGLRDAPASDPSPPPPANMFEPARAKSTAAASATPAVRMPRRAGPRGPDRSSRAGAPEAGGAGRRRGGWQAERPRPPGSPRPRRPPRPPSPASAGIATTAVTAFGSTGAPSAANASRSAIASGYRSAGSVAIAWAMTEARYGGMPSSVAGAAWLAASAPAGSVAVTAGTPVSISYRTAPSAHTSDRGEICAAGQPLGGRVSERPDHRARGGQVVGRGVHQRHDPEVDQVDRTVVVDQDVGGLDIAMDDPVVVGRRPARRPPRRRWRRPPPAAADPAAIRSLSGRPDTKSMTSEGASGSSISPRGWTIAGWSIGAQRLGLAFEPRSRDGIGHDVRVELLDRHDLAGPLVAGAPDRRHPAHRVPVEQRVAVGDPCLIHQMSASHPTERAFDPPLRGAVSGPSQSPADDGPGGHVSA